METFKEYYEVKLNYKKPDGYWVIGHIEIIPVEVKRGVNEKNNHCTAAEIALSKFPDAAVTRVTYQ